MSKCLPLALLGDKNSLSVQARAEIQNLSGAQPLAFLFQVLSAWGVIFAAITLAVYLDNIWMSLLVMVFVATRLSILALLVHEQVHFLGLRGQYGDLIVNLLAAYPLGITVEGYAKVHLAHHKYYFTENDPDFLRKSGIDWTFPMSARRLIKLVASDLFSLSFIKLLKGKRLDSPHIFKRPYSIPKWVRPTFYIGVLAILIYTEMWQVFLMYWFVTFIDNFSYVCTSLGIQ